MTGVARLHCLYLAGVSVVRCQIVFTVVVYLLSVSVFQVLKLFSPGRVSVYLCPSWRLCTAGFTAPALPMLSAPPLCLESAPALPAHLTSTVFWSCLIKTICFSLAIGSRAFCTVTLLPYTYPTPKLSPHRRRCISIFPQKNLLCMIYKRFKLWGH